MDRKKFIKHTPNSSLPTCPLREEKSFSQRFFSIYTDIRKLQDKAKTSYTGIDITPAYIDYANEQAKKENLNAKFICQDIRTITFDKEFDVVLNMADGAIGYLEDDGENHKIFSVIAKALKNGGKPSSDNDIQLMVYSIRE